MNESAPRAAQHTAVTVAPSYLDLVAATSSGFARALAAHRQGRRRAAREGYVELLDRRGLTAVCMHQLGVLAGEEGDSIRAAELLCNAIRLDPDQPLFYQNFAVSLERQGKIPAALDALIDLGCSLQKAQLHAEAIPVYRRVLAADPRRYAAWVNMGTGLAWMGEVGGAAAALVRALALHAAVLPELRPLLDEIIARLVADRGFESDALKALGAPTGRVEMIEHVLATLGKALDELGYPRESIRCYELASALAPGFALAHWNLSLALLAGGDFARGWQEYEWRWLWDQFPEPRRAFIAPEWRGQPLDGKTILVAAEQGYGDAIQFAPLVHRLAGQGARVLFEVTTPLVRLFRESFNDPAIEVIERHPDPGHLPTVERIDYAIPLMSLPARLCLGLDELPLARSYLKPCAVDSAVWAERIPDSSGLRIGLVWAGRPNHADDHRRSMMVRDLRPLFAASEVSWYALQVGKGQELAAAGLSAVDLAPHLQDFAQTAAAITRLHLVITVDTAVAHLAAAMGKPVWLLLPAISDWRWLRGRDDSPWYPTIRIFRQPEAGDWRSVIAAVRQVLRELSPSTER